MPPDVVERIAGGAAELRYVVVEPLRAAIDGFVDFRPIFFWEFWLGLDERHDDERRYGRMEGVVGSRGRGIYVQAFRMFGAAPGSVGALVSEEEFDAAVDGGFNLFRLWWRDRFGLGALGGEWGEVGRLAGCFGV